MVKVTLGWSGLGDTTTIYATSSLDILVSATSTDTTTVTPTITLSLSDPTLALGTPDPGCEGNFDGTVVGEFTVYNGNAGNQGCAYVWADLTVTVKSNAPWTGTIAGDDVSPTSDINIAQDSFRYDSAAAPASYVDCAVDAAVGTTTTQFEPSGTSGINPYTFSHCAIIDWDDSDGSIDSTITYSASQ